MPDLDAARALHAEQVLPTPATVVASAEPIAEAVETAPAAQPGVAETAVADSFDVVSPVAGFDEPIGEETAEPQTAPAEPSAAAAAEAGSNEAEAERPAALEAPEPDAVSEAELQLRQAVDAAAASLGIEPQGIIVDAGERGHPPFADPAGSASDVRPGEVLTASVAAEPGPKTAKSPTRGGPKGRATPPRRTRTR